MSSNTADQTTMFNPDAELSTNQSSHNVGLTAGIISIVFITGTILYLVCRLYLAKLYNRQRRHQASVAPLSNPPKHGLDPENISMLPKYIYQPCIKTDHFNGSNGSALECVICISELVEGDTVRVLPNCKHFFHAECIDKWLETHSSCPMCRSQPKLEQMKLNDISASPPLPQLKLCGTSSDEVERGLGACLRSPILHSPRQASARFSLPSLKSPRGISAKSGSSFMSAPRSTYLQQIQINEASDLHEIMIETQQFC